MNRKEHRREYNRRVHEKAKPAYAALMKFYPLTLDDLDGEIWRSSARCAGFYSQPRRQAANKSPRRAQAE